MERKTAVSRVVQTLALLLLVSAQPLYAAEPTRDKGWKFDLAPFYLWGFALEGDMTAGSDSGDVDVPFDQIFDNLEAAFIVHLEAVKDNRWGLLTDINYMNISGKETKNVGRFIVTQELDFEVTMLEFSGFRRFEVAPKHQLDVILGGRYTKLKPDLTVTGTGPLPDRIQGGTQRWLDPIIGTRWLWGFADRWQLIVRGDVGGFTIGSDIAWQALGIVAWHPWNHVGFLGGYRGLYQDYRDGSGKDYFRYDMTMHGPMLGINFTW